MQSQVHPGFLQRQNHNQELHSTLFTALDKKKDAKEKKKPHRVRKYAYTLIKKATEKDENLPSFLFFFLLVQNPPFFTHYVDYSQLLFFNPLEHSFFFLFKRKIKDVYR